MSPEPNPLRHHPIIDFDGKILICPIVDFLIRRVSSGIYYDLLDVPNVAGRFLGPAVQEIIGKIARSEIKGMRMLAERDYGGKKNRKDTIDWIISDESAHIFIEVKSARIKQSGINDLFDTEASVAQLRRLSNFGVQAYSTLSDALSGDYPHWKPDGLPVYLMVVTLEDWHTVGIQVQREVVEPIRERLSEKGLSPRLPDDFPFIYASSADLGAMLHVANKVSLETVLNKKTSGEFMQWQLGVFLQTAFQDEIQGYRPSAFDPAWNEIV